MELNQTPLNPTPPTSSTNAKWALVGVLAIVVIGAAVWAALDYTGGNGQVLGADTSYQAVFLTNGQVYFGKLSDEGEWVKLSDIYYLQRTESLQQTGATDLPAANQAQSNIQLVKLGSELHGPQDAMYIDRDKILFWENMKDDSKVIQAIHQHKSK